MENTTTISRWPIVFKWGVILGLSQYGLSFLNRIAGLEGSTGGGIIYFLLSVGMTIGIMVLGVNEYRTKGFGGFMKFGQAYGNAFLIGLVGAVLTTIVTFAVLQIPSVGEKFADEMYDRKMEQIEMMEEQGQSEDAIEMTEKMMDMMSTPGGVSIMVLLSSIVGSAIWGLIAAAIAKKNPPENAFPL